MLEHSSSAEHESQKNEDNQDHDNPVQQVVLLSHFQVLRQSNQLTLHAYHVCAALSREWDLLHVRITHLPRADEIVRALSYHELLENGAPVTQVYDDDKLRRVCRLALP